MSEYAVEVENLVKEYSDLRILKEISLKIPKGKITTILGFSGAGKSTLLKHFLGIVKPTKGSVNILGTDLSSLRSEELRDFRRNFGMVFQYAALFDSLTTFENVAFPIREFLDSEDHEIIDRVNKLLLSVGLKEESFYKYPHELSGGMRKRVGLARALALRPKIMLYDEPTTGLDPITTKMVNDLILDTANDPEQNELTSIIISHDVKASLEISDYVAFLESGEVLEYLPVEEFKVSNNSMIKKFIELS
jgi:phospholipid/cholesterol/gamma-HCH transport system ATP-binding protein